MTETGISSCLMCHLAHLLTLPFLTLVKLMLVFCGDQRKTLEARQEKTSNIPQNYGTRPEAYPATLIGGKSSYHWAWGIPVPSGNYPPALKLVAIILRCNIFLKKSVFLLYLEDSSNARDQSHANIFLLQEQKESG